MGMDGTPFNALKSQGDGANGNGRRTITTTSAGGISCTISNVSRMQSRIYQSHVASPSSIGKSSNVQDIDEYGAYRTHGDCICLT